jgi:hypothetical protein
MNAKLRVCLIGLIICLSWLLISAKGCPQQVKDNTVIVGSSSSVQPLKAPTEVMASTGSASQITLTWQDNSNMEDGFKIERRTGAGGVYELIAVVGANITSYNNSGLSDNTTYYYLVKAYSASAGESAYSREVSATTSIMPLTIPNNPSYLAAGIISSYQINLIWVDNSDNETGFKIERRIANGEYVLLANVGRDVTFHSDINSSGFASGTYYYRVKAYNNIGQSAYSNETSVIVSTTPVIPAIPEASSGLVASPISSIRVDLAWIDNSLTESGFKIERRFGANGQYIQIATTATNIISYSDITVTPSNTYYYRVRAYNSTGNSGYSNEALTTTQIPPITIPNAPSGLSAVAVSSLQINLAWGDNSNTETGFIIERGSDGITFTQVAILNVDVVSYANINLSPSTKYYYRVKAYNTAGNSAYSNIVSATTQTIPVMVPNAPFGLCAIIISYPQIKFTWLDNSNNEDGFKIERKIGSNGTYAQIDTVGANISCYSDNSCSELNLYYYRIRAYNSAGNSSYSSELVAFIPTAPSGLSAIALSSSQIKLSWTDNSPNEASFEIERKIMGTSNYQSLARVDSNITTYSDSTVSPETTYYYRIRVWDGYGYSAYSNEAYTTTQAIQVPIPVAPSGLNAIAASSSQINLTWLDNSNNAQQGGVPTNVGESGFKVERKVEGGSYTQIATVGANALLYSDVALSENTKYYYRMRSYNVSGNSNYSNEAYATTELSASMFPNAPSNLVATAISSSQIKLSWTDNSNNESGFKIERKTSTSYMYLQIATLGPNITSFSNEFLNESTTYYYQIRAYNLYGNSSYSNEVFTTTKAASVSPNINWVKRGPNLSPKQRHYTAMAYDSSRDKIILFGGYNDCSTPDAFSDTWEWNGSIWVQLNPFNSPPARYGHAMIYDEARRKIILFGGYSSGTYLNDTWEWTGTDWAQLNPIQKPLGRRHHSMGYDSMRGKIVLFGGEISGNYLLQDTWEWDGINWVQIQTINKPSNRCSHTMAYDSSRNKVILFGGYNSVINTIFDDTWEFNGSDWIQLSPTNKPSGRMRCAMSYDLIHDKMVLFGGWNFGGYLQDIWEWDGTNWVQVQSNNKPSGRYGHTSTYNSKRGIIVLFGGYDNDNSLCDVWEWNDINWAKIIIPASPVGRGGHRMAYDSNRGVTVLFGGSHYYDGNSREGDTWEWDGNIWKQKYSGSARSHHAMAYDTERQKVVLFGGYSGGNNRDTLEWDGIRWIQKATTGPSARRFHAMVYDETRKKIVLFGGYGESVLGDTWEWDGISWTLKSTTGPSGRYHHSMAYDSARQKVVLFGGWGEPNVSNDTWEWDGSIWELKATTGPSVRALYAMAYDSNRQRTVLFGGVEQMGNNLNDTWEWDGINWIQLSLSDNPPARDNHAMVYDTLRRKIVMFGGAGNSDYNDTWELGSTCSMETPSELSATAISSSQIDLSWIDNSDREDGFKIERKTGPNGTYEQIATVVTNITSYSDTTCSSSTTYYYRVRAYNSSGDSDYSNEASITLNQETHVTGIISLNTVWSKVNSPYIVTGNILVQQGVTLTIEPGVIVCFEPGCYIKTEGYLIAQGTKTDRIIFTSNNTQKNKGDWDGIRIRPTAGTIFFSDSNDNIISGSVFDYVTVEYASTGLYIYSTGILVTNSSFVNNTTAIEIRNTNHVVLKNLNIENNNTGIYSIYEVYTGDGYGNISNTKVTNCLFKANIYGVDLNSNQRDFKCLEINNNEFVENSNTAIKIGGGGYGPKAHSITIQDNWIHNNGVGISFPAFYSQANGASSYPVNVHHNIIENNLGNSLSIGTAWNVCFQINNNIIISNNGACYISSISSGINNIFYNNILIGNNSGFVIDGSPSYYPRNWEIYDNTFAQNTGILIKVMYGTGLKITTNNFISTNNTYDIQNLTTGVITATNNYWGTVNIPQIEQKIYDYYDNFEIGKVLYTPISNSLNSIAPILPPLNITTSIGINSIALNWPANAESDIAGYKVYWSTKSGFPYANIIDVGKSTSYTIPNLNSGKYYITVTAYDTSYNIVNDNSTTLINENQTNGNESWYSEEISVVIP